MSPFDSLIRAETCDLYETLRRGRVASEFRRTQSNKNSGNPLLSFNEAWTHRKSRMFYCVHRWAFITWMLARSNTRIKIRCKTRRAIWISRCSRISELNLKIEKYKRIHYFRFEHARERTEAFSLVFWRFYISFGCFSQY